MNTTRTRLGRALFLLLVAGWSCYCGAQVPQINGFTPDAVPSGTTITISGTNFSSVASNNIVTFGGVQSLVVSAAVDRLTVRVPVGALYAPISVTVNGLIGYSAFPFRLTNLSGGFDGTSLVSQSSLTTADYPGGVVMADFDGDGKLDIAVANYGSASVYVFRNISLDRDVPQFDAPVVLPVGNNPYFFSAGDIDGDGKPDLAICSSGQAFITIYRNSSTSGVISFGPRLDLPVPAANSSASIADLNLDGKPDVIVPCGSSVLVFRNIGSPGSITAQSFASPVSFDVGVAPWRVAVGDLDGDGMPDMAVANDSDGTVSVLRNTGTKGAQTFSFASKVDFPVGMRPFCVALADLDLDGKLDVVASTYGSGNVSVFRNLSSPGDFTSDSLGSRVDFSAGASVHTVVVSDVDGDGKPDLLAVGQGLDALTVFLNQSHTNDLNSDSFGAPIRFSVGANPICVAVGDLDGDGKSDVAVANNFSDSISILKNILVPSAPQILSNPHGVSVLAGATVTLNISVKGVQPLTYQWFLNATNLLDGATNASLVLSNVGLSMAGSYSVIISNSLGSAQSADALVAVAPFSILAQPQRQSVLIGQSASFSVDVAGTGPFSYQWSQNGAPITDATNSTLAFKTAQITNTGTYQVLISNAYGSMLSSNADFTVLAGIPVVTMLAPTTGPIGCTVTVTGTNFDPIASKNLVRFGSSPATVVTASETQLTVAVPAGASYGPVSVNVGDLTAVSPMPFIPTFPSSQSISASSFVAQSSIRTAAYPASTVTADIDGDGKLDVIVVNSVSSTISIYRNLGTNNDGVLLSDPTYLETGSGANHVEVADFDGDGRLDIAVANTSASISIFLNIGQPGTIATNSFAPKISFAAGNGVRQFVVADLDGDGRPDIASANYSGGTVSILRNTSASGNLAFAPKVDLTVGAGVTWVAAADLDGDGKIDLAFVNDTTGKLSLIKNLSSYGNITTESFAPKIDFSAGSRPLALTIGDLDGDGKPDLIVSLYLSRQLAVYRNVSTSGSLSTASLAPKFTLTLAGYAHEIAVADLDGDGLLDIATSSESQNFVSVFKNRGKGALTSAAFVPRVDYAAGYYPCGISSGDLNGDGKPELIVGNYYEYSVTVLRNNLAPASPTITSQPTNQMVAVGGSVTSTVTVDGLMPVSYQWFYNQTNALVGQTNATLNLTNIQVSDSGSYFAHVTNAAGFADCTPFKLLVINKPQITAQPKDQSVRQGVDVTFDAGTSGDGPISYQWQFGGSAIPNATNSTLVITNVQVGNSGNYSVLVANPVGSIVSSNAHLTVSILPSIAAQPASQTLIAGNSVTFTVRSDAVFPPVSSGTLALWLKGDAGVVADSNGRVSRWADQSGRTNDAYQTTISAQPIVVSSPAFLGKNALRFDGIQGGFSGDYLQGAGDVGLGGDFTMFLVYDAFQGSTVEQVPALIGVPSYYRTRSYYMPGLEMCFGAWGDDYHTGFIVPTNSSRIWTQRLSNNNGTVDLFDTSLTNSTNYTFNTSGLQTPAPGYFIGGLGSNARNFGGDIAEFICFKGALDENDRMTVETYLRSKYIDAGAIGNVTYQWQLNGSNIDGATNSTLTISNAVPGNAGVYTVVLSNSAGSITSSNAVLTVNVPPSFTSQPQSQAITGGGSVTLSAQVVGTAPLSCQWLFNGAAIAGETNLSLVINNVQPAAAGNYQLSVTSPYGSVLSSNALISVAASQLRVVNASGVGAGTVTVPVQLVSLGNENAVSFSLNFDPTILTLADVSLGNGAAADALLLTNSFQVNNGKLGISLALQPDASFTAGTQEVARVTFSIAPLTLSQVTPINITSDPIAMAVVSANAHRLSYTAVNGVVAVTQADYEADVTPKSDGNHDVGTPDWVKVGRLVAGLDIPASPEEFQRADCAPRETLGNGKLTVTDWVQAGRYAMRLDTLTPVGGPTAAVGSLRRNSAAGDGPAARVISIRALPVNGATNSFYVELTALGSENAIGFSIQFDPTILKFVGNGAGSIPSVAANVNQNLASSGQIGFTIGMKPGASFPVGTQQLVRVDFVAQSYLAKPAKLAFSSNPVALELSDPSAQALAVNPVDVSLTSVGLPLPSLTVTDAKTNVLLSWPSSASGFTLESSQTVGANWSAVSQSPVISGNTSTVTVPPPTNAQFFRLKLQQ